MGSINLSHLEGERPGRPSVLIRHVGVRNYFLKLLRAGGMRHGEELTDSSQTDLANFHGLFL